MKRRLLTLILAAGLSGCAANPLTGKPELSPETLAAAYRLSSLAVNVAEASLTLKLNEHLRVRSAK